MARVFIVGDIHACPAELEALLSALALEAKDHLVFLGDYIDRGPGAREVIDLLLDSAGRSGVWADLPQGQP